MSVYNFNINSSMICGISQTPFCDCVVELCGLIQQKDGVRSLNQECLYGSSRRKRHEEYQSMVKDKLAEAEWKYFDVN